MVVTLTISSVIFSDGLDEGYQKINTATDNGERLSGFCVLSVVSVDVVVDMDHATDHVSNLSPFV